MNLTATKLGLCLSMHFASLDGVDEILKSFISRFLDTYKGSWIQGTHWQSKGEATKSSFEQSYDEELAIYQKLISGIQTRVIGNIVIDNPANLITESESSSFVISFRKIHEDYEIMMFAFAKEAETSINDFGHRFNGLEKEIFGVWESFFVNADENVKNRYYLPNTVFYFIERWNEEVPKETLVQDLNDQSSEFFKFISDYFCVQGTEPIKIPKSVIDDKFYVFRHPSYYYSQELSEKFLLMPASDLADLSSLIRTVDIISSVEFYFTKFFYLVRGVYGMLAEIDEKSRTLINSFYKTELTTLRQEETETELKKFIGLSHELYPKFPLCDKLIAELEHQYSDASHLIGGITANSVYSQAAEKPFTDDCQGAIATIGLEFQMRLQEILRNLPRNLGRLYHDLNSVTNLIKSYYDIVKNESLDSEEKENQIRDLRKQSAGAYSNPDSSGFQRNESNTGSTAFKDLKVSLNFKDNNEGVLNFDSKPLIKATSIEGDMLVVMVERLKEDYKDLIDGKKKSPDEVGWVDFEELIESVKNWKIYQVKGEPRSEHDVSVVVSRINTKVRNSLGLEKSLENNIIQSGDKLGKTGCYRLIVNPVGIEVEISQ